MQLGIYQSGTLIFFTDHDLHFSAVSVIGQCISQAGMYGSVGNNCVPLKKAAAIITNLCNRFYIGSCPELSTFYRA